MLAIDKPESGVEEGKTTANVLVKRKYSDNTRGIYIYMDVAEFSFLFYYMMQPSLRKSYLLHWLHIFYALQFVGVNTRSGDKISLQLQYYLFTRYIDIVYTAV